MKHKRLAALLSLLLALLLVPSRAYADARFGFVGLLDGVQCHNNYADEGDFGGRENYLVYAPDKYSAAVMAVGGDVNSLTAEQKLKLSDSNYGGAFYTYAQGFSELEGGTLPDYVPSYIAATIMLYYSPIGDGVSSFTGSELYTSSVPTQTYEDAKAAYLAVINGEDTGVGGGGDDSGEYVEFFGNPYIQTWGAVGYYLTDGSLKYGCVKSANAVSAGQGLFPCPVGVRIPVSVFSRFSGSALNSDFYLVLELGSGSIVYAEVYAAQNVRATNSSFTLDGVSYSCIYSLAATGSTSYITLRNQPYTFDGSVITLTNTSAASPNGTSVNWGYSSGPSRFILKSGPIVVPPPDPDGDWPSDSGVSVPAPVVPDPDPEPSISGTVVVAPSVTWPDIDITINDNSPEGTTSEDYTPWLRAINENLNSLRGDLLTEFDSLQTSIRNIYTYLQHLDDLLENHCTHLRNQIITSTNHLESYLQGLFTWLGEQLDFSFDDTDLIIWLKRIYSRLGSGDTYKPNPINDDDGFLDWLYELWQNFLIDLLSVLPDSLGGLVETISQLTHYFPFSIPWDLAALLALFEHEPVIPVFDIPFPYASGEGGQVMLHIDLTDWDPVAQMVRPVFVVGFCMQLALITKDLLSGLDMSKGGI